jgi:DNA-binding NarL/FixJ family response regulator
VTVAVLISDADRGSAARLARELEAHAGDVEVVAVCGPAATALLAASVLPDVAVVLERDAGDEAPLLVRGVRTASPSTRVLLLAADPLDGRHYAAVRAGASGAALASAGVADHVEAIRRVAGDRLPLAPDVATAALRELRAEGTEGRILRALGRGVAITDASRALDVSVESIWRRLRDVRAKLELADRLDAAEAAPPASTRNGASVVLPSDASVDRTGETRGRDRAAAAGGRRSGAAG